MAMASCGRSIIERVHEVIEAGVLPEAVHFRLPLC